MGSSPRGGFKCLSGAKASTDMPFLSLLLSLQKYLLSMTIQSCQEYQKNRDEANREQSGSENPRFLSEMLRKLQEAPRNWDSAGFGTPVISTKSECYSMESYKNAPALCEALEFATTTFESTESTIRVLVACAFAGSSEKLSRQVLQSAGEGEAMAVLEEISASFCVHHRP